MSEKNVAPGVCIRQSFPLFEQLAEASHGWELAFRQLSATTSPYRLEQMLPHWWQRSVCPAAPWSMLSGTASV